MQESNLLYMVTRCTDGYTVGEILVSCILRETIACMRNNPASVEWQDQWHEAPSQMECCWGDMRGGGGHTLSPDFTGTSVPCAGQPSELNATCRSTSISRPTLSTITAHSFLNTVDGSQHPSCYPGQDLDRRCVIIKYPAEDKLDEAMYTLLLVQSKKFIITCT